MSFINHKRKYIQTLLAPGYEPLYQCLQQTRGTQRLLSVKYLFGEAKIARIFYNLRKAKNF